MRKSLCVVLFSLLLTIATASAAYNYNTIWTDANTGQPVNGVRAMTFVCENASCDNPLGAKVQDNASATNRITLTYPTPAPNFGYASYSFAACYLYQELAYKPSGSGSSTLNNHFSKQRDCKGEVNSFSVPQTGSIGTPMTLTARIQSPLREANIIPHGEPTDQTIVDNFLSDMTRAVLTIRDSNGQIVVTQQQDVLIPRDTARDFVFQYTPTASGTYTAEVRTTVSDCKCANTLERLRTATFSVEGASNAPPQVTITAPANGASFLQGTLIMFRGSASDAEDGTLFGNSLQWTEGTQALGPGNALDISTLSIGQHVITLTATDSQGAIGSASVMVSISAQNLPIVVLTVSPTSGTAPLTVNLTCIATAGDPPFTFTIQFGDGQSIAAATAVHTYTQPGTYNAMCTVTDADGETASDSDLITVGLFVPQCSDTIDNDGDSAIDFPADFGCTDAQDDDERNNGTTDCSDGVDNDGDGLVDQNDPDCDDGDDDTENPTECDGNDECLCGSLCSDNDCVLVTADTTCVTIPGDIDGDNEVTCVDVNCVMRAAIALPLPSECQQLSCADIAPLLARDGQVTVGDVTAANLLALQNGYQCSGTGPNDPPGQPSLPAACFLPQCRDNFDNDNDNLVDFPADPGCTSPIDDDEIDMLPQPECANGIDDDGDTLIDFGNDPGCSSPFDDTEEDPLPLPQCADQRDNDGDGLEDFGSDPGCSAATDNMETDPALVCDNGIDETDDSDVLADFRISGGDAGCLSPTDPSEIDGQCDDLADNDFDGTIDFGNDADCDSFADSEGTPQINLLVTKTILTNGPYYVGQPITFQITIDNAGNVPVTNLFAQDVFFDAYLAFVSATPLIDSRVANALQWNTTIPDTILPTDSPITLQVTFNAVQAGQTFNMIQVNGTDPWGGEVVGGDLVQLLIEQLTQCNDNIDNDGDTLIDFGTGLTNDPGCTSPTDNDETNIECSDDVDNLDPEDDLVDLLDPGCENAADPSETDPVIPPQCNNRLDDEGDGVADFLGVDLNGDNDYSDTGEFFPDPGCASIGDNNESDGTTQCQDLLDNDGDGAVDLIDPGCVDALDNDEFNTGPNSECSDGIDNDNDTFVDYPDDRGCTGAGDDSENSDVPECNNSVDDDADLLIDYPLDPGCLSLQDGSEQDVGRLPQCFDTLDNDRDGFIDYPLDPGCDSTADDDESDNGPSSPECADQIDNDNDGKIDFPFDPGCSDNRDDDELDMLPVPQCSDGMDNDGDALIDFPNDPGCLSASDNDEANGPNNPQCSNGIDDPDPEDTIADFPRDPGCISPLDQDERDPTQDPVCADQLDNELPVGDGLIDFGNVLPQQVPPNDPGCYAASDPDESDGTSECQDGIDNLDREDTLIDLMDPGCDNVLDNDEANDPTNLPECADSIDNEIPPDLLIDYPEDTGCVNAADDSELLDDDGDGVDNEIDNCPAVSNPLQEDIDNDNIGDACDAATCGNGVIDVGEVCDTSNLNGQTCASIGANDAGTLSCSASCDAFVTTQCRLFQCRDQMDNDADALADFFGVDLNGDGLFDQSNEFAPDPGCLNPTDDS